MIRGNWSLAAEVRKNERKQQHKVQQKQKNKQKLEKLSSIDPIKLYYQIKRLEAVSNNSEGHVKNLKRLKDDWEFIEKKGLHKDKLNPFLKKIADIEKAKLQSKDKLWGQKSIYFNPELNPYGKVPILTSNPTKQLPNLTKPMKVTLKYKIDPIIDELCVVLPDGDPPQFYKLVQNFHKPKRSETASTTEISNQSNGILGQLSISKEYENNLISDSDIDGGSTDTEEVEYSRSINGESQSKRQKVE